MTLHASQSLATFSASVTHPTFSHFVSPSSIFSCCFHLLHFSSNILVVTRRSSSWPKQVAWYLHILSMSDLVVSASQNTVLFDFFAVHEIRSTLHRDHISVASSFFCTCFEMTQASHKYIRIGSI